jgi:hypothetical protein
MHLPRRLRISRSRPNSGSVFELLAKTRRGGLPRTSQGCRGYCAYVGNGAAATPLFVSTRFRSRASRSLATLSQALAIDSSVCFDWKSSLMPASFRHSSANCRYLATSFIESRTPSRPHCSWQTCGIFAPKHKARAQQGAALEREPLKQASGRRPATQGREPNPARR